MPDAPRIPLIRRMRIESIANLEDGWHDGVGKAVTPSAVMAAKGLLSARPRLAGKCHIYPTEMGGILFELMHTGWDCSIEVRPNGEIEIFGVQVDGPNELDTKLFPSMNEDALKCLDGLSGGRRA